MGMKRVAAFLFLAAFIALPGASYADDEPVAIALTLKDHKFEPAEIKAPAGKAIAITLKNEDDAIEEFDSNSLRTEKIVTKHGTVTIKLKPLAAGRYPFQGEFHAKTAQGMLIVE
ncbi:MAG: cupredoxin domain-containing protein [Rhodomicrobium sp.]